VREAALLQTFPPDYFFDTTVVDRACEMIGNALLCDFAAAIAAQVAAAVHAQAHPNA
jgi:DNA (cytosine-5)-methyltransferase 1